jgi:hypothetical protein
MANFNFNLNNLTDYEEFDEEIRIPDNTIREVLVNDYNNNNYIYNDYEYDNEIINNNRDYELQLAINESIKEQEEYRIKQLEIMEKTRLRIESFKDVLFKIKKISMIDAKILKFYNIIEPIIESYCACNIDIYECDKALYDEIFSTLKTIRLTESEFGLFKNLFIM